MVNVNIENLDSPPERIHITEDAVKKVYELIIEEGNLDLKLRLFIQGGGCSGFQYGLTFDDEVNEDDFIIEKEIPQNFQNENNQNSKVAFLVDSLSLTYLEGAKIEYKEDIEGAQFVINNPNATTTCGCGSSFSWY